ncbi:hypothetical protein [Chondromyces crocatus]|nr:hypothetical protein [Chondromyces crocatus]
MHIDARGVNLKTVAVEDRRSVLKLRDDSDAALERVMLLTPEEVTRAGLNPDDVDRLRSQILERRRVMQFLKASERMTDKLWQTSLAYGHTIAGLLGEIAAQGRRRARLSPDRSDILDALLPLIRYQSAPARKAHRTRTRNEGGAGVPSGERSAMLDSLFRELPEEEQGPASVELAPESQLP